MIDTIVRSMAEAVLDVSGDGFVVVDILPGLSRDDLQARTEATLRFPD